MMPFAVEKQCMDASFDACLPGQTAGHLAWFTTVWYSALAAVRYSLSTKTECNYLNDWIKKRVTYAKIYPKIVNSRDIAGECTRRR